MSETKKQILVLTTSVSIISAKREDIIVSEKIIYICFLVSFQKGGKEVNRALINSGSEINAMTLAYAK